MDEQLRWQKGRELQQLAIGVHCICHQEVHGDNAQVLSFLSVLLPRWEFCHCAFRCAADFEVTDAGGVAIGFAPEVVAAASDFDRCGQDSSSQSQVLTTVAYCLWGS